MASGLHVNMAKSFAIPIRCDEEQSAIISNNIQCDIKTFPCRYLGLPLSIRRLNKTDLQPILNKVADSLPGWKAALMAKSGRLIVVRFVITAMPIHLLIALDVPKWFIKAVDKYRRGFLWAGRKDAKGGNCPVNWARVTRPLHLWGLGIHNLETLGWALRMHWMWLQKTDPHRPWSFAQIEVPPNVKAMFYVSISTTVGDGSSTLFWVNRWLHGRSIADLAPALMPFVRRRGWRTLTVCEALHNNRWTKDVQGGLSVLASWQLVQLWVFVQQQQLAPEQQDSHCWLPNPAGGFSTHSVYLRYFTGSINFEPYKRVWRSWAPLKIKLFVWLAALNHCWTADKLARRGLQHPDRCLLCDQSDEDVQHILATCPFSRGVWFHCLSKIGLQAVTPTARERSFQDWWRRASRRVASDKRKGFNSLVLLVVWELWKYRNRCVFDNAAPSQELVMQAIREEVQLWHFAGAKKLQQLGYIAA